MRGWKPPFDLFCTIWRLRDVFKLSPTIWVPQSRKKAHEMGPEKWKMSHFLCKNDKQDALNKNRPQIRHCTPLFHVHLHMSQLAENSWFVSIEHVISSVKCPTTDIELFVALFLWTTEDGSQLLGHSGAWRRSNEWLQRKVIYFHRTGVLFQWDLQLVSNLVRRLPRNMRWKPLDVENLKTAFVSRGKHLRDKLLLHRVTAGSYTTLQSPR